MHDLRKKALLESGKTQSRKQRSKETTPSSSRGTSPRAQPSPRNSRIGSAINSANVSDDESEFSDVTQWSTHSIDETLAGDIASDEQPGLWMEALNTRIEEICDRKRSSYEGREDALKSFDNALIRHFAQDEIHPKVDELLASIIKSVKSGATEKETVLALKALALIFITDPSDGVYEGVIPAVRAAIADSPHAAAKIAAIHTLSVATFYSGVSEEETEATLSYLLDIASSDGNIIDAEDNADVVTAALEEWGFLATQLDDVQDMTEEAMDTFVEQLESTDVGVQIAAGDNIALLFEKSFTEVESDDEADEENIAKNGEGEKMIKRYTVYRQQHQLEQQLAALAKASSKRVSKKDRKSLHLAFTDVLRTVEQPTRGPRYSTALDEDGREFGSRLKVGIHGGGKMTIDTWWKLHRLNALKRLLQGGFMVHYEHNQVVFDSLPVPIEH